MTVAEEVVELDRITYFLRDELFSLSLPSDLPPDVIASREREVGSWLAVTRHRLAVLQKTRQGD